ncbi:MAG: glycosyltransferase [Allosphingosinicella sp.]
MLRVLTLSTLFPDASRPGFGLFVERQTLALAALGTVAVEVVAARGLPPWPLTLHPHYRARSRLPGRETWKGLTVHRPRFTVLPGTGAARTARAMATALLPRLRATRRDFPFDVIDAEFFWPDGVAAMHLARALRLPFSIKARGSDIHYWSGNPAVLAQMRDAADAADGLLAVSAGLERDMKALGLHGDKVKVHYTGIDLERFRPRDRAAAKAALGIAGPLLVSAGALIPLKGQALAIEAMAALPEATLMLVGEGPERPALERLAKTRGVAERVRFLGSRPHGEMAALLGAADLMVLPSQREGLANIWIESLACGTPVLIPDVGGAREVLDRPEAGRLVARDAAAIASAAREMLADPPAQEAVRKAAERFSWSRNAAELAAHLSALSGQRHQRGGDPASFAAQQAPDAGGGAAVHHLEPDAARLQPGA